jgi:hypothetical protein
VTNFVESHPSQRLIVLVIRGLAKSAILRLGARRSAKVDQCPE